MAIRSLSAIFAPVNTRRSVNTTPFSEQPKRRRVHRSQKLLARSIAQAFTATCVAVMVFSATGCSLTSGACRAVKQHDCLDDFMIGYRNQVLAARAWHENKHCHANRGNQRDFKAGFMQGYIDVAKGGNGCAPSVAPESYWGWKYQSADGQNGVNAWFAGYPLGAQLAEQDGVNQWSNIRPTGANAPQQKQAVYVPPVLPDASNSENPFYDERNFDQRYPYEPVEGDSASRAGSANAETDDEPDSPIEADRREADTMELNDTPSEPKDISDAIREALEAPVDNDSVNRGFNMPTFSDAPYQEPPYEPSSVDQVHVMIKADDTTDDVVEFLQPQNSAAANPADTDEELRFTFE